MKEDLRVSVIQMEARCGETERNLRRIASVSYTHLS